MTAWVWGCAQNHEHVVIDEGTARKDRKGALLCSCGAHLVARLRTAPEQGDDR